MSNSIYDKDFFVSFISDSRDERIQYLNDYCSIFDLELMACELYYGVTKSLRKNLDNKTGNDVCGKEKELLYEILRVRRCKIDANFEWNDIFKKQLLELNQKIINGFSMAYKEAKMHFEILKERMKRGDKFIKGFNIEIVLKPFILEYNVAENYMEESGKGIYYLLYNILPDGLWSDYVYYEMDLENPLSNKFEIVGENFNVNEYLGDYFNSDFICWGMYDLLSNCKKILSWYDILKINEIWVEVKVDYQHFLEDIGRNRFWSAGIQSLSENEAENLRQEFMSTLPKEISGLPVQMLVDEMNCWEKLGPYNRVKFQGNTADMLDHTKLYSMSIEKEPRILVKDAEIDLSNEELEQVRNFVSRNVKLLNSISKGKLTVVDFAKDNGRKFR